MLNFSKLKNNTGILILLSLMIFSLIGITHILSQPLQYNEYKNNIFSILKETLENKKSEVLNYLNKQENTAISLAADSTMITIFTQLLNIYNNKAFNTPRFYELERVFEEYYVHKLGKFYDVLLVDNLGNIFFSIKKEKDLFQNIHNPQFQKFALSETIKQLKNKPVFVDYEYYSISAEPASFYIVPIFEGKQKVGCIVLQLSLNKINNILTNREGLGRTGEVYLINQKHLMLTQSRFFDEDTVLTKTISTEAIQNVNSHGFGKKVILDYRKKRVLSAYEKIHFNNIEWIIVAEMDETEVITNYYLAFEDELFEKIKQYLKQDSNLSDCDESLTLTSNDIRVDMQEYQKSKNGNKLYTVGVASCTGLAIYIPNKFGYLLHIAPTDEIYNHSLIAKWFIQDEYTNMVDSAMERIQKFELYPYEMPLIHFGIVATHSDGFKQAIHKILDYGAEMSQITIYFHPNSSSVNVMLNYKAEKTIHYWKQTQNNLLSCSNVENVPNLGDILKNLSSI